MQFRILTGNGNKYEVTASGEWSALMLAGREAERAGHEHSHVTEISRFDESRGTWVPFAKTSFSA